MWNSYWRGRSRRDLPQVNYNESSEEEQDDFDSPLQSPTRPPPTRAGSPVQLAIPTLGDNVDEELAAVSQTLSNVGHTHAFRGTRPRVRQGPEGVEAADTQAQEVAVEEVVVEGFVEGGHAPADLDIMPDPVVVDFEDENGQDGEKAIEFSRTLKLEFSPEEVDFWFTQLENEMFTCDIKSQWLKRCILVKNLPPKVQADVKGLLILKKSEAPEDIYKQLKTEILRIHAPEKEATYKKALSRVLVGLPSQLGQCLINDICKKTPKLKDCCCAVAVYTLWTMQLPVQVRSHVADMNFDYDSYQAVFKTADKIFLSTKTTEVSAGVAAVSVAGASGSGAGAAEVAAVKPKKNFYRNNNKNNKPNNSQSSDTRIRHKSNPSPKCCDNHYRWAENAWFCLEPHTCPLVNKCGKKPEKKNKD